MCSPWAIRDADPVGAKAAVSPVDHSAGQGDRVAGARLIQHLDRRAPCRSRSLAASRTVRFE